MRSLGFGGLLLALFVTTAACDNGATTTPTPAPATISETLGGVVPPPVGGVRQSSFVKFTVVQSGTVSFVLTKATQFYPGGTVDPAVIVGLAVGTVDSTGTVCTVPAGNTPTPAAAGFQSGSGTLTAGPSCIQVSDLTGQSGEVDYTIVISHS